MISFIIYLSTIIMTSQTITEEYLGKSGVKYIFEYHDADSFVDLPQENITQCYGIAFYNNEFLVVNNVKKPGSYTPVGGSVEPGEHCDNTLIREIQEESNMKVLYFKPIGYQKVTDTRGIQVPFYQLRYFCIVEPYGPFVSDPDGNVTEIVKCNRDNYKKYFDWGKIGDRIIERAYQKLIKIA